MDSTNNGVDYALLREQLATMVRDGLDDKAIAVKWGWKVQRVQAARQFLGVPRQRPATANRATARKFRPVKVLAISHVPTVALVNAYGKAQNIHAALALTQLIAAGATALGVTPEAAHGN